MKGKILKISSNDLYGNVDERQVIVFSCFNHLKYMNRYVLFTFLGEYDKKKLYYGSVHMKDNSIVIFAVNNNVFDYIDKFKNDYMNGNVNSLEYEIIDIDKIEKVELVSYNEMSFDKLKELEEISLKKESNNLVENSKEKKPIFLYILLIILILFLIGITYLYFRPDDFKIRNKTLVCDIYKYNYDVDMDYQERREVIFDQNDHVKKIEVTDSYIFLDKEEYDDFKNSEKENQYFKIDGTFKYDDSKKTLMISYQDKSIIDSYDDMRDYLKNEGYNCIEGNDDE